VAYVALYSAPRRTTGLTVIIDGLAGARCTLSSTAPGSSPIPVTVPGTIPEVGQIVRSPWGANWPVGTYTLTATCTLNGYPTATATQVVHII
jgi:hypothetical protein